MGVFLMVAVALFVVLFAAFLYSRQRRPSEPVASVDEQREAFEFVEKVESK